MVGKPGGMGQVFAAEDMSLGLTVAIKVPSLTIILAQNGAKNFLKEARIAAHVGPHPNVVQIRACLTDPELRIPVNDLKDDIAIPFIVMELLGGGNLAQRLNNNLMSFEAIELLFKSMCAGVHCAHSCDYQHDGKVVRGVIHRDLKPENICFDAKGRLVVVDFGLARLLEDPSSSGGIAGTPSYMAPEQWMPHQGIDHRTDIYALGIILFQMVTGTPPFVGPVEEVMKAHLYKTPPDPRTLRPDLPHGVAGAILRALEKEKEARFADATDFLLTVGKGFRHASAPIDEESIITFDARIYRDRGDALARRDEYDAAIIEYDKAIRVDPADVLALVNRGFCWYRKGIFNRALPDYTRALQVDPTHADAYNNRGMVWKEMGEYDKAIADFRQTLRFDPDHPLAPNNLREALKRMT